MRKFPRGILGIKCPRLSRTETSTVTVMASVENVGTPSGMFSFLENLEGIFGCSCSGGGVLLFLGRATVSLPELLGPCARENTTNPSEHADNAANTRRYFMVELYQKDANNAGRVSRHA